VTPFALKIIEIGPDLVPLATRVIRDSLLAHYPKFMGEGRLRKNLDRWAKREARNCTVSPRGRCFLAFRGPICVAAMMTKRGLRSLELVDLFVARGFTSAGIGSALFEVARLEARRRGLWLTLNAMAANKAARRFYERHGGRLRRIRLSDWGLLAVYEWKTP
jgi:ribosomal protein S18 acetylase RimI-like enzyme